MRQVFMVLMCGMGCAQDSTDEKPASVDSGGPSVERAQCDVPFSGVDWGVPAVADHNPGIDAILDAVDYDSIDAELDISSLAAFYRGGIAFALEIEPGALGDTLLKDDVLEQGHMGRVVLASLATDDETGMDYMVFRQGLQRYYTCSRGFPLSLEGFERIYGVIPSEYTDVDSVAKCATRRLRLAPSIGIYVAESLWEGEVRETEILLTDNRTDGQLDFLVYGADGILTDRSQFPTLGGGPHLVTSAPYTCMTCHLNSSASETAWGYDLLVPTTGPCPE
jgi:hypothetical protein